MEFLDYVYRSKPYQTTTAWGPFKLPNDALNQIASGMEGAAKVVAGTVLKVIAGNEAQTEVQNFHVPLPRNFTRSINGIVQAIAMLIVAAILKNKYKSPIWPLLFASTFYGSASVRHLTVYPSELFEYNVKNQRLSIFH